MSEEERQQRLDRLGRWFEELHAELAAKAADYPPKKRDPAARVLTEVLGRVWIRTNRLSGEEFDQKFFRQRTTFAST